MSLKARVMAHQTISGITGGMFLAVQGLFFLEKGAEPWQLGLLLGAAVVSTTVFELPFGALADIYGRIKVFRLARTVFLLATIVAIFATSFWYLMLGMALFGLAEALKTGAIDAWAVEQINTRGEKDKLQSYLSVFDSSLMTGLTIGAIGGGYIPELLPKLEGFPPSAWNLIIMCGLIVLHLLATPYLFKEGEEVSGKTEKRDMFGQIKSGLQFSKNNRTVRDLLLVGAMIGLGIISVESYWQARLTSIIGEPTYSLLGWITAGYFMAGIFGPILITAVANRFNASARLQLLVMPIVSGIALLVLATQTTVAPFVVAYMAIMLFISMFYSPMATLLNNETSDDLRSTMQSMSSLSIRGGAAISALGFAALVKVWGIQSVWQFVAGITLIIGILRIVQALRRSPEIEQG